MTYNFAGDTNCVSLFRFESGALTTDSKGTNTLTNTNVVDDEVNYSEGLCAGYFDGTANMRRNDADLSADFPLKNGTSNTVFSFCARFRSEAFQLGPTQHNDIINKRSSVSLRCVNSGNINISLLIGGETHVIYSGPIYEDEWYHIGVTYDDSTKNWFGKLYRYSTGDSWTASGVGTTPIPINGNAFYIGCGWLITGVGWHWNGQLDEVVIFKDILSEAEIDEIRGLVPGNPWNVYAQQ